MAQFRKIDFPIYLIISGIEGLPKWKPFVAIDGGNNDKRVGTYPHMLDTSLLKTLPPITLALHFPRTFQDFASLTGAQYQYFRTLSLGQRILFYPIHEITEEFCKPLPASQVRSIFYEDDMPTKTLDLLKKYFPESSIKSFGSLKKSDLRTVWKDVASCYGKLDEIEEIEHMPTLSETDLDIGIKLPSYFLARQMGISTLVNWNDFGLYDAFELQAKLEASIQLERQRLSKFEVTSLMDLSRKNFKFPLSIVVPGVASKYIKALGVTPEDARRSAKIGHANLEQMRPPDQEIVCASIIACHEALTQNGISLITSDIPKKAFEKLDQIEEHLLNAHIPKGRYVWKALRELNNLLSPVINEELESAFSHADRVTAYTRFPIGFKFPSEGSSPFAVNTPIVYRPILPLTRSFEQQFCKFRPANFFGEKCKILMADFTEDDDQAGNIARKGSSFIKSHFGDRDNITIFMERFKSIQALNSYLEQTAVDMLIITAHGFYKKSSNAAGIICGGQFSLGEELKNVPKFVFLRSCNVIPFGISAVSIIDILLRNGAYSVIGSSVPIYAFKSNHILVRLLTYLSKERGILGESATLLDAWFHALGTNPVLDILTANEKLYLTAMKLEISGKPLLKVFMEQSNLRRTVRKANVYKESGSLLLELTQGTSVYERLKEVIDNEDYVPETIFYKIFGWPERIYLNRKFPNNLSEVK